MTAALGGTMILVCSQGIKCSSLGEKIPSMNAVLRQFSQCDNCTSQHLYSSAHWKNAGINMKGMFTFLSATYKLSLKGFCYFFCLFDCLLYYNTQILTLPRKL